ncbi:DUF6119 family protein [Plantactinospora sp. ZYX-F-223]|uniref:DUF6119 family protein n=1 Tax=Plantactinospora sp. ZYX-F-223 TaxID=3144103 RepID=UPI0031FC093B
MKLNIFLVPSTNVPALESKFESVGLRMIHESEQHGWQARFYFSANEEPNPIPWVETYADFFQEEQPANLIYFAAYTFRKDELLFVLTYGKSHFYVRPFCDHDFGIEMAKRIGNESDIKQTASKKFAGKKKKEIKSYARNTPLNIESGESVDYLRAAIEADMRDTFGRVGKFGSSMLIGAPVTRHQIGSLLDAVSTRMQQAPRFKLPRTTVITDDEQLCLYNGKLLNAILAGDDSPEFAYDAHEVVGVELVFAGNERYTLSYRGGNKRELGEDSLDLTALRSYIADERIGRNEILNIRVRIDNEGQKSYSKRLGEALEFVVEGENVMLSHGRWVRFNEDYVDQLNVSLDGIEVDNTEPELRIIDMEEGAFNNWEVVQRLGYVGADKDFSKIKIAMSTPIEAWDLQKGGAVYAVKFGTTQKLGYACDQASNVLEIIRNNANTKRLNQRFTSYCLWFGFKLKSVPNSISDTNSIILKQKIDAWARRCRDLGVEPRLKFSQRS